MVIGTLNYLASSIAPSLFRNGSVLTRRDVNGTDDGGKGVVVNTLPMEIMEGRQLRGRERPQMNIMDSNYRKLHLAIADWIFMIILKLLIGITHHVWTWLNKLPERPL